jgi:DNA helicase II / ATP-dependent DNA helicase PcrA
MNENFYHDLALIKKDEKQFEAYDSMANTVVIAGPGSGKTRVLSLKAMALSKMYIHEPSGLACISFSRESVRELESRLKSYGYVPSKRDFVGTVHGFSLVHVIQPFAHLYPQYQVKYPIKIIDSDNERKIYNTVLEEMGVENPKELPLVAINRCRALRLEGMSGVTITSTKTIQQAATRFEELLMESDYLDFTSIINLSAKLISEQEFVRKSLRSQFPWLLVDEYQDLGKPLHEMVLELTFNAGIKLYAVGDVNQSIYGFTGGYPDFLEELKNNDDIELVELEANYRSSPHIIEASLGTLQLKPPMPNYSSKNRADEAADFVFVTCKEDMDDQYRTVSKKIIQKLIEKGVSLNEIGIIVGSNQNAAEMAQSLQANQIPFFIAKWDFENSDVVVWLQKCAGWCLERELISFEELFRFWRKLLYTHDDDRRFLPDIELKVKLHKVLTKSAVKETVFEWCTFLIDQLDIRETLANSELYPDEIANLDVLLLEARLRNLKDAKLSRFADLRAPNNEVTISTRHSCKGLEFEVVIMLGMEDGKFPYYLHKDDEIALAEDSRLCYVCVSRAKKTCILLHSSIYNIYSPKYDKVFVKPQIPSPFWAILHKKFGTAENTFTQESFN